ncbi:hypothetical protein BO71DRAFT_398377 [Aspergillus ellipticus CBS 707.79]|uniref:Uncharacterized protein n=1 Tax=Aspergillus ellipticus CBS 707.79 TaxID=1448320 RepID=A0A319E347_9EURO|nr:hypothetical protein BO71DRAFT_398377 [Aspergillus ellipticus CBS 707.79]
MKPRLQRPLVLLIAHYCSQVANRESLWMRKWERGPGEYWECGNWKNYRGERPSSSPVSGLYSRWFWV